MSLFIPIMEHNSAVDNKIDAFKDFFVVFGDDADYDEE